MTERIDYTFTDDCLWRIKLSITDDSYGNAKDALSDYTRPLLSALKSCAVFEVDKAKRDVLIETIRKYEPNFLL